MPKTTNTLYNQVAKMIKVIRTNETNIERMDINVLKRRWRRTSIIEKEKTIEDL